jgi:TrmH family RNA methyltransferase
MQITSVHNPRIKSIVRLRADARQRRRDGLMLVEGIDEINLALSAGVKPVVILTAPSLARRSVSQTAAEVLTVSSEVFEKLSYRENPDGWLAVFQAPHAHLEDLKLPRAPLLIVVEAIEKPGNLGAILRTADAAGADAVLVCDRRVDVYGPNVVRASRGTLFSVPVVAASSSEALGFLQRRDIRIVAATPANGIEYTRADLRGPLAVAVGTEDRGLTETWLKQADVKVQIPMRGKINSLNVSIAAALLLYEALRQRAH